MSASDVGEARRAFEKHQGRVDRSPSRERPPPRRRARRQKAGEQEGVRRQAGQDQRGHRRRRARHGGDRQILGERRAHELEAGIGNERRAGIRHQRQRLAAPQRVENGGPDLLGIVVVIGVERLSDPDISPAACR